MTNGKKESGLEATKSVTPAGTPDPKRPHATLDLKAIEVVTPAAKSTGTSTWTSSTPGSPKPAEAPKSGDAPVASAQPKAADNASSAKPADASSTTSKIIDTKPVDTKPVDPKAKTTPVAVAPKPAKSGGGIGSTLSHLVAGVVGGAMTWYGASTLGPQLGLPELPTAANPATTEINAKLTVLEKALAEKSSAPASDVGAKLAAAEARLAKLEDLGKGVTKISDAQAKIAADNKSVLDQLAQQAAVQSAADGPAARLAKLEERLKLMSDAATGDPQAGKLPQLAAITGRVVDLEATLNAQLSAVRKTVSQELESRLSLTNETSEAAKSGTSRIDRELSAVKTSAATVAQKIETLKSDGDRLTQAVQGIRDESNTLKTALDAVRSDVDAKFKSVARPADVASAVNVVAGKVSALEQNIQNVVKSDEDRKTNAERIVLALELNNLKRVLDRGQAYGNELAEVKKAAGTKVDLTILERYKDTGIATLADLTRDFRPIASAIIEADADPVSGSVMDRMMAGAKSVIRVRKISASPTDKSVEAIVARMEAALKEARVVDVLAESKAIPAKASSVAQEWLVKVEARASVDRAITGLETALKSSISGAPAAPALAPAPATPDKPTK
jgi:hypothetical protein